MELPKRKPNRLTQFHYNSPGAYFITICTQNRKKLFWTHAGAMIDRPQNAPLTNLGQIVHRCIGDIPRHYPAITVDHFVIMPDHIHLLLQIHTDPHGRSITAPTISTAIRLFKGTVSKQAGFPIWQKGYYDHVIRSERDYQDAWNYIEGNPCKSIEDHLCI